MVGRPNTGKSTLINNLIGQKIAAVSPKPQTTQEPIHAYYEDERGQIFFLDTPGLYQGQSQQLSDDISKLLSQADVIVYVVDPHKSYGHEEQLLWSRIQQSRIPVLLVFNKLDLGAGHYQQEYLSRTQGDVEKIISISASKQTNLEELKNSLFDLLNYGQRNTAVDSMTVPLLSHNSREYLSEIIKEKIFMFTDEEVPYQTQVKVTSISQKKTDNSMTVKAQIHVTKDRYKSILIGKNGQMIKKIGQAVRQELELATNKHITIRLTVVS